MWFLSLAFAQDAPDAPDAADPAPPPVEAAPADPAALLHLAETRQRHGDPAGARLAAEQALALPGDHHRRARYLVAMSWEFGGDPEQALAIYDELLAERPEDDVHFRRAECLAKLGRYGEARDALRRLGSLADLAPVDRHKVALLEGTFDLALGRERRGERTILRELAAAAAGEAPWYQATARHALLVHHLDEAARRPLAGSERAKARALEARARLVLDAEQHLAELVRIAEPTFALDGFARVARAYEELGDELLAQPLDGLTPAEREVYRDRVEGVWVNGAKYYDRALQFAALVEWTGEPVPSLRLAREALLARIDALGTTT